MPLLSLVGHGHAEWESLLAVLGAPADSTAHFEYRVPSPKLGGNPSQTDVLLMSSSTVWAIEAKWTEPRYETVASRLSKPESDGGDPRLTVQGWLDHLEPYSSKALQLEDFTPVVYQVLHRAASACAVATRESLRPELVYLHFHPSPLKDSASTAQYISDLQQLRRSMGETEKMTFRVVEMPLQPTAAFDALKDLDKHARSTSEQMLAALSSGPLFTSGSPVITTF